MIEIYTTPNCTYCTKAKEYLKNKGIDFKEIDMSIGGDTEIQKMKKIFKQQGFKTLPIIKGNNWILPEFDEKLLDDLIGREEQVSGLTEKEEKLIKERLQHLGYMIDD